MTSLLGAILAGGEGRRMGGRKEGVTVPGGTLLSRSWNALAPAVGTLLLQGRDEAPEGLTPSPDLRGDRGPLAGVEGALRQAVARGSEGVVVLAVDLPRVTAPVVLELVRRWRALPDPGGSAVVADTRRGLQPLAGVYGAGLAGELTRWLDDAPDPAARAWVEALGSRVVRVQEAELETVAGHPEPFLNVNAPAQVERALELPSTAPPVISVVGWKDAGKTGVAVGLTAELRSRGLRVMALKHGHHFRLDTPGTDSWRLRHEGGAERILLAGPDEMALLGGWGREGEPGVTALAARHLAEAEVVVVEGWKREPLPAVEVVHCGAGDREPLWTPTAADRDRFLARVLRECPDGKGVEDAGGPRTLDAADPGLLPRLADVVEVRILPGTRWLQRVGVGG